MVRIILFSVIMIVIVIVIVCTGRVNNSNIVSIIIDTIKFNDICIMISNKSKEIFLMYSSFS